jgi:SAM-dependent methyltransferase
VLDLGHHPFADTFLKQEDLSQGETVYPLVVDLCGDCGQAQLKCVTDPDDRYVNHDYSYTSSNSSFSRGHWEQYAKEVAEKIGLGDGLVVEIGSNDGYLAKQFLETNRVVGVDPSPAMAALAKENGVDTVVALFGSRVSEEIAASRGKAELIIANNVFNHAEYPQDFVKAVAHLLASNGTFVFELPYWKISVESGKFDQVYHEHVSYFTVASSEKLLQQANLHIYAAEVVNYHGGSLRMYARHDASPSEEVERLKAQEREAGLFDPATYVQWMEDMQADRAAFLQQIYEIKKNNGIIIAVGAAAKGNTFLNFYNLDHKTLSFVTDASEHKQGKFTPYTRIPIAGDEIFAEFDEPYALILSWNISEILKQSLLRINPNIKFITPWRQP